MRVMRTAVGAMIVSVMDAEHPPPVAVIVALCAVPGALNTTLVPVVLDSRPAEVCHVAAPKENVSLTRSPTPMSVRARSGGRLITVSDVISHSTQGASASGSETAGAGSEAVGSGEASGGSSPSSDGGTRPVASAQGSGSDGLRPVNPTTTPSLLDT